MSALPQRDDGADVLRVVRAAGLAGFEQPESPPAQPTAHPDKDLALIRAVGLPGFKDAQARAMAAQTDAIKARRAAGEPDFSEGRARAAQAITDALALARAAGLPGFNEARADAKSAQIAAINTRASAAPSPCAARMTRQSYAVLDVAPGGEAALAQLESTMGTAFAANRDGRPYWFGAVSADGGTSRAFTFMASQLTTFADLLGEVGSSALRFSVRPIDRSLYGLSGPGSSVVGVNRGAPQLPPALPGSVRTALGR